MLKIALELKSIIVWKLKSHQIFHWKTEGAASPSARQLLESQRERAAKGLDKLAQLNKTHFFWMLVKLATVAETLALIWASRRGDRCGAGEMTGKKSAQRDREGKGLSVPETPACPVPREKAPSARPICQAPICLSRL